MNNSIKKEKFRKLSIVSLVTGILALVCVLPLAGALMLVGMVGEDSSIIFVYLSLYLICLPIPAIVFGIIDLRRIKAGLYSNKGIGLDIAGIALGGTVILYYIFTLSPILFSFIFQH